MIMLDSLPSCCRRMQELAGDRADRMKFIKVSSLLRTHCAFHAITMAFNLSLKEVGDLLARKAAIAC